MDNKRNLYILILTKFYRVCEAGNYVQHVVWGLDSVGGELL